MDDTTVVENTGVDGGSGFVRFFIPLVFISHLDFIKSEFRLLMFYFGKHHWEALVKEI